MPPQKPTTESQPLPPIEYRRAEDFRQDYANNGFLESNPWDLTIRFGQLDLSIGPSVVIQHMGVTLPWPQVKVMLYLLQTHLMAYEFDHGRCPVPKGVIPKPISADSEAMKNNPRATEISAAFRKHYDDFMAANPEAK